MDFDLSFEVADERAVVQVLDFEPMEYEYYGDRTQITFIELQNVASGEIFLETEHNQLQPMPSEDVEFITSYESFVRNLKSCKTDAFENWTNSTTIENSKRKSDENEKCRDDCNCARCLQMYFNAETSDFDCLDVARAATTVTSNFSDFESLFYVGNVTNVNLAYDFTRLWNEAERTEYMDFQRHEICTNTSGNVKLLLRNSLAKSNTEGNDTADEAAGFYNSSAADSLMDL